MPAMSSGLLLIVGGLFTLALVVFIGAVVFGIGKRHPKR